MTPEKQVVLIDGSSFLYRAYYGMQPLHAPDGRVVHAVYGFCRMLKKLINTLNSTSMVLVWDSKGPTVRHEFFKEYKATRQAPPRDLFDQKVLIKQFADLIGLTQVEQVGFEADDILGSLARSLSDRDFGVVVVSSDKDLCQLLAPNITIFDSFKDQEITRESFVQKMGFASEKITFYHALLGDASDNIPGVKGIGKQGALELVQQFDSLADLYERLDQVQKPRLQNALRAGKESAFLSYKLFLLQPVNLALNERDFVFDAQKWDQAIPLFQELGFKSLIKNIQTTLPGAEIQNSDDGEPLAQKYIFSCITTRKQLDMVLREIYDRGVVALDTETTGCDARDSALAGVSLCCREGQSWYIPVLHATQEHLPAAEVVPLLAQVVGDVRIKKIMHNAKFDIQVLERAGMVVNGLEFDTMVAARLVLPEWQKVGLKVLSQHFFDERMLTFQEVVEAQKYPDFSHVPLDQATAYAAADAHQTFKLWGVLQEQLEQQGVMSLYRTLEHPLIEILCAMEREGIACDAQVLRTLEEKVSRELVIVEQEIYGLTGALPGSLNLNSPKQLEQLLFGTLQLPPQKMSAKKTGYSTDQEVLEILARQHIVPRLIVRYRELAKLRSTYLVGLVQALHKESQKIHTSFSQTSVATGRLASLSPNLQNIPVQVGEVTVRSAFKAPAGYVFISADYSQIELRVLAHLARDQVLLESFQAERDIHAQTAAKLFGVSLDQVDQNQRQIGKRINFSIMYGLTPYGLSKDLNIAMGEAKRYIDMFFQEYPGVKQWMDVVTQQVLQQGYVTTWFGRKRFIPGIYEKNKSLFEAARRVAINTPAQGTAAEIMKFGMIKLYEKFKQEQLDAQLILQIHDEVIIKVAEPAVERAKDVIKKVLEGVVDWQVPLRVALRVGKTWQDVTK